MPTVRDKATGKTYELPDADALQLTKDDPSTELVGDVDVSQGPGSVSRVSPGYLNTESGWTPADPSVTEAQTQRERVSQRNDTVGSRLESILGGGLGALSFGAVSPFQEQQEAHPGYSLLGGLGAAALTLPFGGEGAEGLGAEELGGEALNAERTATGVVDGFRTANNLVRDYTPLGWATKGAEAVGDLIPGTGRLAKVGRIAAEGATIGGLQGGGEGLVKYLNDPDPDFSGEVLGGLARGAAWGGGIGLGLGGLDAAIGGAGDLLGRFKGKSAPELSADKYASRMEPQAPDPRSLGDYQGAAPLRERIDLSRTPGEASMFDSVNSRIKDVQAGQRIVDDMLERPAMASQAGWDPRDLKRLGASLGSEETQLLSFSTHPDAELPNLASTMHENDVLMARMSEATDRVPSRWSDPQLRAQQADATDATLRDIAKRRASGIEVSPAEEDGLRVSAKLGIGSSPEQAAATQGGVLRNFAKRAAGRMLNGIPGGRWLGNIASGFGGGALGAFAVDRALEHGAGAMLGHLGLEAAGIAVGGKLIRLAARDPRIGGIVAGGIAHALNSEALLPGDRPRTSTDPRRALRELADSARRVSPQAIGARVAGTLSHLAGGSPMTVAKAAQVASTRHAALLQLLDAADPPAVTAGARLMGRPLPSGAAAAKVADFVKATSHPLAPLLMALDGRLTGGAMAAAAGVFPTVIARLRQRILGGLVEGGHPDVSGSRMRILETLLGPQVLGGPGHGQFYRQTMATLAAQKSQPQPPQGSAPPPAPPGPIGTSPLATPAQRAAHPDEDR